MRIVPPTTIQYQKFIARAIGDFGVATETYSAVESVEASVQPGIVASFGGKCVELKDYKEMGLDWSRRYITAWMPGRGLEPPVDRNGSDRIIYGGRIFNVLQVEDWEDYNGWQRVYAVCDKSVNDDNQLTSS